MNCVVTFLISINIFNFQLVKVRGAGRAPDNFPGEKFLEDKMTVQKIFLT